MFSRVLRSSARTRAHIRYAVGATVVTATYLGWTRDSRRVFADEMPSKPRLQESAAKGTLSKPFDLEPSLSPSPSPNKSQPALPPDQAAPSPESDSDSAESTPGFQGAYNPETGEFNWDCPCLGGMAHGPCGQNFRDAFSCFVHSESEPQGMDCIVKFEAMQACFREHPEVYGDGEWEKHRQFATLNKETGDDAADNGSASEGTAPDDDSSLPGSESHGESGAVKPP